MEGGGGREEAEEGGERGSVCVRGVEGRRRRVRFRCFWLALAK